MPADSGVMLTSFREDAASLSAELFSRKHGSVFLIRALIEEMLQGDASEDPLEQYKSTLRIPAQSPTSPRLEFPSETYAYRLLKIEDGPISVGRAPNHRVCIDDASVSGSHATLAIDSFGRLVVTDKNSTNGTLVGGVKAIPFAPTVVPFGKSLTFGAVDMTALPCEQFIDFISMITN